MIRSLTIQSNVVKVFANTFHCEILFFIFQSNIYRVQFMVHFDCFPDHTQEYFQNTRFDDFT